MPGQEPKANNATDAHFKPLDLRGLRRDQVEQLLLQWGEPRYRLEQLYCWLYRHLATSFDEMSNLPVRLRERLKAEFAILTHTILQIQRSNDGTIKFLFKLTDGHCIETVLIPSAPEQCSSSLGRRTLCISSQVGCAFKCAFCASGQGGLVRNLAHYEIIEQMASVERWFRINDSRKQERVIDHIVVMGIGEPLANYENLMSALETFNAPWGFHIGARRITISTCGIPHRIIQLADRKEQFRLALSLHAPTDEIRSLLMPVNRIYPLREVMEACRYWAVKKNKIMTLEYILIEGVNTQASLIRELARIAKQLRAKVNLIPYNEVPGKAWNAPSPSTIQRVVSILSNCRVPVTVRQGKGNDIHAACGQLRAAKLQQGRPELTGLS